MVEIARRSFITGLVALVAAPAIVRVGSLMPVKTVLWSTDDIAKLLDQRIDAYLGTEPAFFIRYSGYEPLHVIDPNWVSAEEAKRAMKAAAKLDLDRILNDPRNLALNRAAV